MEKQKTCELIWRWKQVSRSSEVSLDSPSAALISGKNGTWEVEARMVLPLTSSVHLYVI